MQHETQGHDLEGGLDAEDAQEVGLCLFLGWWKWVAVGGSGWQWVAVGGSGWQWVAVVAVGGSGWVKVGGSEWEWVGESE